MAFTLKSVFNMLDQTKYHFCQPILLQIGCTGYNNGITLHIKFSTFCLQQNRLTELTPEASSTLRPGSSESQAHFPDQDIQIH